MQEREISLIDLMVEVLLHWRAIIIWMLVGALLMGAFSYVRSIQPVENQKETLEQQEDEQTELASLEEALTEAQKYNVQLVLDYEEIDKNYIQSLQEYYNQSVLMQIDAANIPRTELTFLVKADTLEQSYSIERIYEDLIAGGLEQWLAEDEENIRSEGISELVKVERGTGAVESDSFCIQIIHVSEEQCNQLAQQVIDYIADQHEQLVIQVGAHEIVLVHQSFAWTADTELLNQQKTILTNIAEGNTVTEKLKAAFSEEEQSYYDFLKGSDSEEDAEQNVEDVTGVPQASVSIQYVLLGMVLFAFVYVFYLFIKYILENKLRATDDVKEIYALAQLGQIPQGTAKKKVFSFVDLFILRLRDRNKRAFSEEEAIKLASVAVKMAVKRENLTTVYFVGSTFPEKVVEICKQIEMLLRKDNIALYTEIEEELEMLKLQKIKVLGMIKIGCLV